MGDVKLKKIVDMVKRAEAEPENFEAEMYKSETPDELAYYFVKVACDSPIVKCACEEVSSDKVAGFLSSAGSKIKNLFAAKSSVMADAAIKGLTVAALFGSIAGAEKLIRGGVESRRLGKSRDWIKANRKDLAKDKNFDFYFNALKDFSPVVAKNPVSAIPVLEEMKEWGSLNPKTVESLSSISNNVASAKSKGPRMLAGDATMLVHNIVSGVSGEGGPGE